MEQQNSEDFFDENYYVRDRRVRVGTASWTDQTLIKHGGFYPRGANSAEDRLRFYAKNFNLVEVDSSYYHLPNPDNARRWVERTPVDFVFNVKAFSALTQHPVQLTAIPPEFHRLLPDTEKKRSIAARDIPPEIMDWFWNSFLEGIDPLRQAGRLGVLLFQFPKWFPNSRENREYIVALRERLRDYTLGIEFRQQTWMSEKSRDRTIAFLRDHQLVNVAVDAPQGESNSIPLVAEVTAPVAVLRLHGRRAETWNKAGVGVTERFRYLYEKNELKEMVPVVEKLLSEARETHVLFNNCYADYSVRNAREFAGMLNDPSTS